MCSPARSTLMSGYFPAQHGVKYTLEEDMPASEYPQVRTARSTLHEPRHGDEGGRLQRRLQGQVALLEAGAPGTQRSRPTSKSTASRAGTRRTPAPTRTSPRPAAASSTTTAASWNRSATRRPATEGALQYLSSTAAQQQPFFMVDLAGQPARRPLLPEHDLRRSRLRRLLARRATSSLPATVDEDLSTKPTVQEEFLRIFNLTGKPKTARRRSATT